MPIEKNSEIRIKLKNWLENTGRKNLFVAKAVDLSPTSISLFLSNKRDLTLEKLILIENLIDG